MGAAGRAYVETHFGAGSARARVRELLALH